MQKRSIAESTRLLRCSWHSFCLISAQSPDEVQRIYAVAAQGKSPLQDTALISVLLHGLRAQEVAGLNLADFDGRRLHIRKAKSDSKGYVPLRSGAIVQLNCYLEERQQQGEVLSSESPMFLSCSRRSCGQRLSYWGIRDVVDNIKAVTGIDLHAHRFRHTFATELVSRGMDSYHVMTLLRHKSVQSTKRYTKRADQLAAEMAFYQIVDEQQLEGS